MNSLLQSLERLLLRRDPRRNKVYLTRVAWLLITVITFVGVAAALLGINQFIAGWGLQPLDRPAPTVIARPGITPTQISPCVVSWQFIPSTPVSGDGNVGTVNDPAVIEKVKADYLTAWNWMYANPKPWAEAQATWFYQGRALELVLNEVRRHLGRDEFYHRDLTQRSITGLYFTSPTQVFFGDLEEDLAKIVFNATTGQEQERIKGSDMVMWQVAMAYDPSVCRWKIIEMREQPFKIKD